MVKWLITLLIFVLLLTFAFKYSAFIATNKTKKKESSVSMIEVGKIIKDIRNMGKERKEDLKEKEKEIGETYE